MTHASTSSASRWQLAAGARAFNPSEEAPIGLDGARADGDGRVAWGLRADPNPGAGRPVRPDEPLPIRSRRLYRGIRQR